MHYLRVFSEGGMTVFAVTLQLERVNTEQTFELLYVPC